MNSIVRPPIPVERALCIYIEKQCTWNRVSQILVDETGHKWTGEVICSAVNRFRAGVPRRTNSWTDEKIELLKQGVEAGDAYSKIAERIGGISRNAAIGMARRLGFTQKKKVSPRPRELGWPRPDLAIKNKLLRPRKQAAPPPLTPDQAEYILGTQDNAAIIPIGQRCTINDLTVDNCHWPVGDPRSDEFFFCGGKAVDGGPYCEFHTRMAYWPGG